MTNMKIQYTQEEINAALAYAEDRVDSMFTAYTATIAACVKCRKTDPWAITEYTRLKRRCELAEDTLHAGAIHMILFASMLRDPVITQRLKETGV